MSEMGVAYSVMTINRSALEAATQPGLSLQNTLQGMAGVWISDRGHYALGERVLIRGMGWRSAFGVRGIQVLLDGIPLTLPDGQATLDIVDPAFIRQAEVVRGPSSTFWGNGSGGVLVLSTDAFSDSVFVSGRVMGGSYGVRQASIGAAIPLGRHRLHGYVSTVQSDGYREYAEGGFTRAALHGSFDLGSRTRLRVMAAMALQDTESPGGLTREQVEADARGADSRNMNALAGKESTQIQAGATLYHETGVGLLSITSYVLMRELDNPLSYAYVDLSRRAGGFRIQLQKEQDRMSWGIGVDGGRQVDDRLNFNNVGGAPGQEVRLDQQEEVRNLSAFAVGSYALRPQLSVTAGLRADNITFSLQDYIEGHDDVSGDRSFSAVSPSLGISYQVNSALFYANVSTAFETPTTTELVNQPGGGAGLNSEVGAQKTKGIEIGTRGTARLAQFDVAVFAMQISDRLLPFQDDSGRTFYRNAGESRHSGVEIGLQRTLIGDFDVQVTYTGSRFEFEDADLRGNRIPGVPQHHLFVGLKTERRGLIGQISTEMVSETFANDSNTAKNEGYLLVDLSAGYSTLVQGGASLQPFIRVANVFDKAYVGSMVVNAFGGRYFEPSPGRTVQIGVSVSM